MEKGLKTLQTAGRAARRHSARQSSPEHSQHSASEFDDSGLGFPSHSSPMGSVSHLALPNPQHSQVTSSLFPHGLTPLPSQQQRAGSISSASSANASIPPPSHVHHQSQQFQASQQRFSYPSNQSSLYSTTAPSPSSYMTSSAFGNMTFSPTSTTGYAQTLPSFSRGFEATSRTTQPALPPLLPSLLTTSRTQQEPITASY